VPGGEGIRVPFNVVDEVVHNLDTDTEPWSIQLEVRVEGSLDEGRLRTALSEALLRHPMARARKAPTGRPGESQYEWEIPAEPELDPLRVVDCADDDALAATRADLQSRGVPLAESPPLRMRLARNDDGDVLMVNANHAAMDGFGTLRLVQSVARAYAGEPDPVPDLDPLEARNVTMLVGTGDREVKLRRLAMLADKVRDLPVPTTRLARDGGRDAPGYGFHHLRMSAERTRGLAESDLPGTVNDVLLAALHLAVDRWNDEHGSGAGRIGVMVPVNMRPEDWSDEVVGNLLLPVRVTTTKGERTSPLAALEAIVEQSRRIKEEGSGGALIEVLSRSPSFPLRVKQATSPVLRLVTRRLADTVMLSNLGSLDEPPAFGAEAGETTEMWFSGPARMPLGASIGVVTTAGRLHAAVRYRHPQFGRDAARRFTGQWVEALDTFLAL
jgi:NRPS condensation-like uncharacterized protein